MIADCLNTRLGNYREACRDACLTSVCGILSVTDLPTETSKNRKTNNISTTNPSPMMEFFNATHSDSFAKIDTSQCTLVMVRDSDEYGLWRISWVLSIGVKFTIDNIISCLHSVYQPVLVSACGLFY
mgnify:CR=1 FL=1